MRSTSPSQAVIKISGKTLTSRIVSFAGFSASKSASTAAYLGQRPLVAADASRHAEHFVARPEARHAGSHSLDDAGEVDAKNSRQRLLRVVGRTRADFRIEGVHPAPRRSGPGLLQGRGQPWGGRSLRGAGTARHASRAARLTS